MSVAAASFVSRSFLSATSISIPTDATSSAFCHVISAKLGSPRFRRLTARVSVADGAAQTADESTLKSDDDGDQSPELVRRARRSADWKAARAYNEKGVIYEGRVEGFNGGGLLIRFYSLVGISSLSSPQPFSFLQRCMHDYADNPQVGLLLKRPSEQVFLLSKNSSPWKFAEPNKSIQEIAKELAGSTMSLKVVQADEAKRRLIFSEKEASWIKYSRTVKVGDVFDAKVGVVEDYGAFVHMCFPDGLYHLTGLVHVSEVSWDLVQDLRDVLSEGDQVRVKVVNIDSKKSRITLSIKQLEEDPLLETLDKVITQNEPTDPDSPSLDSDYKIEPLPGLETIFDELLTEEGISDVIISRQGFEKRVFSPDLQLWLSNAPAVDSKFTLLARAGRQVQEILLTTWLDQEGVKSALQRVLERVP